MQPYIGKATVKLVTITIATLLKTRQGCILPQVLQWFAVGWKQEAAGAPEHHMA